MELRKAVKKHNTPTSDKMWDGPAMEAKVKSGESQSYYFRIYAWQDSEGDPEVKATYRFIHHEIDADGNPGAANIRACQTGIAVLNGARGGTTIPSSDKKGVWNHLAKHIEDAGLEPAPLRASEEEMELRSFNSAELRVDDSGKSLIGYAAVFDEESLPIFGLFREIVRKGAFKKTIQESDIRALWNHDPSKILGRNKSGTLELKEDEKGLSVRINPPEAQWANDLIASVRRGDVNQMSFGFKTIKDNWFEKDDEMRRELLEVRLFDVSPVTFPAYPQTSLSVRQIFNRAIAQAINTGLPDTKLFKAFMRLKTNEELRDEEIALLNDFANSLQKQLQKSEPSNHSETAQPEIKCHSVEFLKKQLRLLQIGGN